VLPQLPPQLPAMNYGKKDEDAELGLVKVDRTQVFQEGELPVLASFVPVVC
jgi:coatomer protein complex subunit gamma